MTKEIKYCEIYSSKICDDCNECNICDLDPNKLCDSCGKCIELDDGTDYVEVDIDGILDEDWEADEYTTEEESVESFETKNDEKDETQEFEFEYIEDIPELKKEYDEKIYEILHGKKKSNVNTKKNL